MVQGVICSHVPALRSFIMSKYVSLNDDQIKWQINS